MVSRRGRDSTFSGFAVVLETAPSAALIIGRIRACNPTQASIYAKHYDQNSRRDGTLRWSFSEGSGFFLCRQKSRSFEDWDERHQDATSLGALPGARPRRR